MNDLQDNRWIKNRNQLVATEKKVILTFDDGPSRYLHSILDILREKNTQVIFFWQSRLLYNDRPWKRVIDEGHVIGAHTHNHINLAMLTSDQQYKQIKTNVTQIEKITGVKVQYFRPPFGQYNEDTMCILKELNLVPMMWEISSFDWNNKMTPQRITSNIVENILSGSIILLHELEQTVSVLPELIDKIKEQGFEFVV